MTIWHPAQNAEAGITPYPWSIKDDGAPQAYIQKVTFLNSYKGIYIAVGSAADVRNIYGSAYEVGIRVNSNYALAQYKNFNFSTDYLAWSGLATGSAVAAHRTATR
ncbi:MAG: hypothetical protein HC901_01145, partial [Bdellovibrionaceae bacterium]|nr:hypothetical protein [Pseudobdellovibrionaceae bacterium]